MKTDAKRGLQAFGLLALLGSVAGGVYYFLFMRSRKPQVELYFDDGSMLALPGDSAEAQAFMNVAGDVLRTNPVST